MIRGSINFFFFFLLFPFDDDAFYLFLQKQKIEQYTSSDSFSLFFKIARLCLPTTSHTYSYSPPFISPRLSLKFLLLLDYVLTHVPFSDSVS